MGGAHPSEPGSAVFSSSEVAELVESGPLADGIERSVIQRSPRPGPAT